LGEIWADLIRFGQ